MKLACAAWLRPLVVLALSLAVGVPYLAAMTNSAGALFTGHEPTANAIFRLEQLDVALRHGHFPPRWAPDLAGGYGIPFFSYYQPLFYLVAELFVLAGAPYSVAFQAAVIAFQLATATAMFLLARDLWGDLAGALAAVLLTYAPYRTAQVYVRGALAEFTAPVCLLLLLWAGRRYLLAPRRASGIAAAAALGLFSLSHNAILLPGFPLAIVWLLAAVPAPAPGARRKLAGYLVAGLALGAWFWLPALAELGAVQADSLSQGFFHYGFHFVTLGDLVNPFWGGTQEVFRAFPKTLGSLDLALAAAALALLPLWRRRDARAARALTVTIALLVACGLAMHRLSEPLWRLVPLLSYVQFPWRLLTLASTLTALAGAAVLAPLTLGQASGPGGRRRRLGAAALAGLGAVLALAAAAPRLRAISYAPFTDVPGGHREEVILYGTTTMAGNDYVPRGVRQKPAQPAMQRAAVVAGAAEIAFLEDRAHRLRLRVAAAGPARLQLAIFSWPGWRVRLDGRPAEPEPLGPEGLIEVAVPAGEHTLEAVLMRTPVRLAAEALTLAALAGLAGHAILGLRGRPAAAGGRSERSSPARAGP